MKMWLAIGLISISTIGHAASAPVSAESFLSKSGELSFKIQNYSKDTGFDCVISYDLRTYDEDHAYLRTAANLQTKVIFIDKNSSKRIKSEFELAENEKIAELAHAVQAPDCVAATKSRAVNLKNYYRFEDYIQRTSGADSFGFGPNRNIILKADFKDISQFEIISSFERKLKPAGFMGGWNPNPEQSTNFGNGAQLFFMNERRQSIMFSTSESQMIDGKDVITTKGELFVFNNNLKTIEKFISPEDKNCAGLLSTNYLMCAPEGEESAPTLINPLNAEVIRFDSTTNEALKDLNADLTKCQTALESSFLVSADKGKLTNRCIKNDFSIEKFEIFFDKELEDNQAVFKFASYNNIREENLKLVELRAEFPWALFYKRSPKPAAFQSLAPKEGLVDAAKRLFNKNISFVNIITTGREDYFDVFFNDDKGNGYFGRIYWNELQ